MSQRLVFVLIVSLFSCIRPALLAAEPDVPALIQFTKEWLEGNLRNTSQFHDGVMLWQHDKLTGGERYRSIGYQRGLAALRKAKVADFDHPLLLTAVFIKLEDYQTLFLVWLGCRDDTSGVYVQDGRGNVLVSGVIDTTFDRDTLVQTGGARTTPTGPANVPELKLRPEHLMQRLCVGLVEKDGTKSKPIQAFGPVPLFEKDKEKGNQKGQKSGT
jgi:hypothetical protein